LRDIHACGRAPSFLSGIQTRESLLDERPRALRVANIETGGPVAFVMFERGRAIKDGAIRAFEAVLCEYGYPV
jgi:hypothetical protein